MISELRLSKVFYKIAIKLLYFAIFVLSFFNLKAKKWLLGRKNWLQKMQNQIDSNKEYIWFHCASFGEYQQALPLILKCKTQFPAHKICLSFFSSSGYDLIKANELITTVLYLPLDTKQNAKDFIELLKPKFAIFIKYEWWFNFFETLNEKQIPLYVAAATFRKEQLFFKFYGTLHKKMLHFCNAIFVQNELSKNLLEKIKYNNVFITGDTRFDAVFERRKKVELPNWVNTFKANCKIILIGSSYKIEDNFALQLMKESEFENVKFVIVPHEINENYLQNLKSKISNSELFSDLEENNFTEYNKCNTLIINKIGLLFDLYSIADISIIGGGFDKGIHNILEPVSAFSPVLFGPKYKKANEAIELVTTKNAFVFKDYNALKEKLKMLLKNTATVNLIKQNYKQFVKTNLGCSDKIIKIIQEELKL